MMVQPGSVNRVVVELDDQTFVAHLSEVMLSMFVQLYINPYLVHFATHELAHTFENQCSILLNESTWGPEVCFLYSYSVQPY